MYFINPYTLTVTGLALVFIAVSHLLWQKLKYKLNISPQKKTQKIVVFLLSLTVLGFFLDLNYNLLIGDIFFQNTLFSVENIVITCIPLVLIPLGYVLRHTTIGWVLLMVEFLIWVFNLFYFKNGYAVGIIASPLFLLVIYDILVLYLRLLLMANVFHVHCKTIYLYGISFTVIFLKIFLFPLAYESIKTFERETELHYATQDFLLGEWRGTYQENEYYFDTITDNYLQNEIVENSKIIEYQVLLKIDSNSAEIEGIPMFEGETYFIKLRNNYIDFYSASEAYKSVEISEFNIEEGNNSPSIGGVYCYIINQDSLIVYTSLKHIYLTKSLP